MDELVNLQYLSSRWYDPTMGRFINEDTYEGDIKNPLSLNPYTYVENNPITRTDPSGHWFVDVIFLVGDVASFAMSPSLGGAAWIGADVASFADPTGIASTAAHAAKAVHAAAEGAHAVAEVSHAGTAAKGTGNALVKDTGSMVKNTGNLRSWAKSNGWEQKFTDGGVEMWGVKNADGTFSWRLKLKPEVSTREGLGEGSNQPRFDARLDDKGTYINPFTGATGGKSVGTHVSLGK